MSDDKSLVNFGDLTKPATVLIEKVSAAVGVLYEPRRIVNKAEAEVKADKIKALASIELSEIAQRGVDRLIYQETRKQENIESITASAVKEIPESAKTEELEEDWVAHFFDRCENVSDKEMQSLWSSLLAGEATDPGTYSRRTVDFVASMDKKDAELFTQFCNFTWSISGPIPLVFTGSDDNYSKYKITYTDLQHLDSIGLISLDSNGYVVRDQGKYSFLAYGDILTMVEHEKDKGNELGIGNTLFTQTGKELQKICGSTMNIDYYQDVVAILSKKKITLSTVLSADYFQ